MQTDEQTQHNHFPSPFNRQMICLLDTFGLLKVSGKQAGKLLQGQLTCDIENLIPGQTRIGAHCNPQGRMISLFYIVKFQDVYYLFMLHDLVPLALTALKKYAVFYQVELQDISADLMIIGHADQIVESELPPMVSFCIPGNLTRYVCAGEKTVLWPIWERLAKQHHMTTTHAWKHQNIVDGIPLLYPGTSEKLLPHDIHLHQLGGIDFNKGCYTGQEIITRMHYRGKLKNHLYRTNMVSTTPLYPGLDVSSLPHLEKNLSGILVDASLYKTNEYDALIVTRA